MLNARFQLHLIQLCGIALALCAAPSALAVTGTFTGGDVGEGLDHQGVFPYAINIFGPTVGNIDDAVYLRDNVPGVTLVNWNASIGGWANPNYGASSNDNKLEVAMQSIRHVGSLPGTGEVQLAGLVPGQQYKVQVLATESCCNRGYDIFVEGALAADNFNPQMLQGGINGAPTNGAVMSHVFTAGDTVANVVLVGATGGAPDTNPIISAITLEHLNVNPNAIKTVGTFTGGDMGEGLDLKGNFPYAINVGGPSVTAGDVTFSSGNPGDVIPGAVVRAVNHIPNWASPNLGASSDDNALETVMQSIRWTAAGQADDSVSVDMQNIQIGRDYKLQLLFTESCCDRVFDVIIDGVLAFDDLALASVGGINGSPTQGIVVTYQFKAFDNTLNVLLNGINARAADNNPTLSGLTLELIPIPEPTTGLLALLGAAGMGLRRRRAA